VSSMQELKERVYAEIDKAREELIELTSALVQHPSLICQEKSVQDFVADELRKMNADEVDEWIPDVEECSKNPSFIPDRDDFSNSPVVCGTFKGTGGGRSIILNGHIDVVAITGNWEYPPFGGVVDGERIYGRGAGDMKAGVAANMIALRAIQRAGIKLKGDVLYQTVIGEESGSCGAVATIVRGHKADALMIPECTGMKMVTTNAGAAWVKLTVRGKAALLANAHMGVNAIKKCNYIYEKLEEFDAERKITKSHPMLDYIPSPFKINVGKMNAGVFPSGIPDVATMEIRYGISPIETADEAKKEFEDFIDRISEADDWLREHKPEIEWLNCCWHPSTTDVNEEIVQLCKANADAVRGETDIIGVAFSADAAPYVEYLGIPYVLIGPGRLSEAHVPDEWVSIPDTVDTTKIIAATVMDWCGCEEA